MKKYTIHTRSGAPIKIEADGYDSYRDFTEFRSPGGGCIIRTDQIVHTEIEEIPPTVESLTAELAQAKAELKDRNDRVSEARHLAIVASGCWTSKGRFAEKISSILTIR